MNRTILDSNGNIISRTVFDLDTGVATTTEAGKDPVENPIDPLMLAELRNNKATEDKKAFAEATIPQLIEAAETLGAMSTNLKALPIPTDPNDLLVGQTLTYLTDVTTAICAGLADLIDTLDKDLAFKNIQVEES